MRRDSITEFSSTRYTIYFIRSVPPLIPRLEDYRDLRSARPVRDTSTEHYTLQHLAAALGDRPAADLRVDDLVAYAQQRADMGAGPYTVNMDIGKLGTVLRVVGAAKGMALPDVVQQARPLLKHLGLIGGGGRRERRPTEDELRSIVGRCVKSSALPH